MGEADEGSFSSRLGSHLTCLSLFPGTASTRGPYRQNQLFLLLALHLSLHTCTHGPALLVETARLAEPEHQQKGNQMSLKISASGHESEKYDQVLNRAVKDQAYRQRLKTEPVSVLREAGIDVPEGVEVRVREFDPNCRYLFLPPATGGSDATSHAQS